MTAKQARKNLVQDAMPGNIFSIVEKTGLGYVTVYRWLKQMHKDKETHIVSWSRKYGSSWWLPIYDLGEGQDKRKPRILSRKQIYKRYRSKPEVKARDRGRYWADKAKTNQNTWLGALIKTNLIKKEAKNG